MREGNETRHRGRPGYGERKELTVRVSKQVGDQLWSEAQRLGLSSPAEVATVMVYESLGLDVPKHLLGRAARGAGAR